MVLDALSLRFYTDSGAVMARELHQKYIRNQRFPEKQDGTGRS
jgi:hypothetical protein